MLLLKKKKKNSIEIREIYLPKYNFEYKSKDEF